MAAHCFSAQARRYDSDEHRPLKALRLAGTETCGVLSEGCDEMGAISDVCA